MQLVFHFYRSSGCILARYALRGSGLPQPVQVGCDVASLCNNAGGGLCGDIYGKSGLLAERVR